MKIYIHIGVHKTASTLLQESLRLNHERLTEKRVSIVVRNTHHLLKNQLRLFVNNKSNIAESEKVFNQFFKKEEEKGTKAIVLSDENLLGAPPSSYYKKKQKLDFYPRSIKNIKRLKKIFGNHEIVWLIYTRKQHTLIPSLYKDGLKYFRYSSTLSMFLDGLDENMFRFDSLVEKIRKTVGQDKIIIKNYESIENGTNKYIETFFNEFVSISDIATPDKKVNVSLTTFQSELFRLIADNDLSLDEKNEIKAWIMKVPKIKTFSGESKYKLTQEQEFKLQELFADDISYKPKYS